MMRQHMRLLWPSGTPRANRAALKERSFPQSKEERLQQAEARSYCSVCHKKGHWNKDIE